MSSELKTLVITGFTSEIAKAFLELACARTNNLKILRCGRNPDSDFRVDFSSAKQTREFIDWLAKTRPDYLFLNHGVLQGKRLSETADAVIAKRNQTPTKSFSTSRDVGNLVHFLLVEADNIQGENINVNGGIFIP